MTSPPRDHSIKISRKKTKKRNSRRNLIVDGVSVAMAVVGVAVAIDLIISNGVIVAAAALWLLSWGIAK